MFKSKGQSKHIYLWFSTEIIKTKLYIWYGESDLSIFPDQHIASPHLTFMEVLRVCWGVEYRWEINHFFKSGILWRFNLPRVNTWDTVPAEVQCWPVTSLLHGSSPTYLALEYKWKFPVSLRLNTQSYGEELVLFSQGVFYPSSPPPLTSHPVTPAIHSFLEHFLKAWLVLMNRHTKWEINCLVYDCFCHLAGGRHGEN